MKTHNVDEILAAGGIDAYNKKHNIKTDMREWSGIIVSIATNFVIFYTI